MADPSSTTIRTVQEPTRISNSPKKWPHVADRGMGRGLAAILSVSPLEDDDLRRVPVGMIKVNPRQPRSSIDDDTLQGLAASIGERGVLQPILVRPLPDGSYELIAGERRWRAAQLAGLEQVPALVRDRADAEALEVALIENMAREDLNPVDEARACAALVEELGLTREDVGRRVGRSRVAVSNLMRLLDLPDEALDLIAQGLLTEGHGRAVLLAPEHADRRRLAREAASNDWSVRHTEAQARAVSEKQPSGSARRAPRPDHPDQLEAAEQIADALGSVLGTDVKVRAVSSGYRAELLFADADEAVALARRIGPRRAA
jgi:ParB family chromosome partitioning protein